MKVLAKLRVSLITRDFTHFRSWLSGRASTEDLEAVASQSEQAAAWLTDIVCDEHGDEALRNKAFHSLRLVGPAVFPALRKAYDREKSLVARGRLHMCMMDIINRAGASAKQSVQMPPLAEREIPRWLETLKTAEPRVRGWAVMILVAFRQCRAGTKSTLRLLDVPVLDGRRSVQAGLCGHAGLCGPGSQGFTAAAELENLRAAITHPYARAFVCVETRRWHVGNLLSILSGAMPVARRVPERKRRGAGRRDSFPWPTMTIRQCVAGPLPYN